LKELPKVNNGPTGENSPYLVALSWTHISINSSISSAGSIVNRMGEFLPIGRLFNSCSFL
jgi:hypothetical protein